MENYKLQSYATFKKHNNPIIYECGEGGGSRGNHTETVELTMRNLGYKYYDDYHYTIRNICHPKEWAIKMIENDIIPIYGRDNIDLNSFVYYFRESQYQQDMVFVFFKMK